MVMLLPLLPRGGRRRASADELVATAEPHRRKCLWRGVATCAGASFACRGVCATHSSRAGRPCIEAHGGLRDGFLDDQHTSRRFCMFRANSHRSPCGAFGVIKSSALVAAGFRAASGVDARASVPQFVATLGPPRRKGLGPGVATRAASRGFLASAAHPSRCGTSLHCSPCRLAREDSR